VAFERPGDVGHEVAGLFAEDLPEAAHAGDLRGARIEQLLCETPEAIGVAHPDVEEQD
jgi:hypothetical protein